MRNILKQCSRCERAFRESLASDASKVDHFLILKNVEIKINLLGNVYRELRVSNRLGGGTAIVHDAQCTSKLSAKLDSLDAYQRRDCVIFSGSKVPPVFGNENCPNIIRELIRSELKLQIDPPISTAHRLGKPPPPSSTEPDNRSIIVRFCQKDIKNKVYDTARKHKIRELYVNESLTITRRKIMAVLRQIVKTHKNFVRSCSTFNGNCYVYTLHAPNAPETSRAIKTEINTMEALDDFCANFVKKPMEDFLKPVVRSS